MAVEAAKIVITVSETGADKASKSLGEVDKKIGGMNESLKQFVAAGGIALATKAILDFADKTVKAFGMAQTAALRLETVAQMKGLDGAYTRFTKLSGAMQTLTGVSDEVVKNLASELLAQGKSVAMTEKMIKAAANLSAVTGDSLDVSLKKLNNTLSGQASTLGRTNPEIAAMTKEQLLAGGAIDYVSQAYDGMAEKMSKTVEVSAKLRDQTAGDLTEAFGEFLAPAAIVVNEAMTGLATAGINVMAFFNQIPGPIRLVVTAFTTLTAVVVALAIAQATGLSATIADTAAKIVSIAKVVAETVAKWALYASTMAVNAAVAVGVPTQWAAIAAAVALTAAVTAGAIAMTAMAQETQAQNTQVKKGNTFWEKQIELLKAHKAEKDKALGAERVQLELERSYANTIIEAGQAKKSAIAMENAGAITREESLVQQIEAEKKLLQLAIDKAKKDPSKNQIKNINNLRAELAGLETALDAIKTKEDKAAEDKKKQEDARLKAIKDQEDAKNAALQTEKSRWEQTQSWLASFTDEYGESIEDTTSAWQEQFDEIKKGFDDFSNFAGSALSSLGTIAGNYEQERLNGIQDQLDAQSKLDSDALKSLEASGATEEEIAKAKETYDNNALQRQADFDREKKKIDREAAIRAKAFAVFEATIRLPIMIMEGFVSGGPLGAVAGGVLGGLQLAAAASAPIPSAQFGGEFIVPPGYQGDSGAVRVNSGEKVTVSPVRDSGNENKRYTLSIGQRDFEGYLQEVLNSGRVTIQRQGVVRYA